MQIPDFSKFFSCLYYVAFSVLQSNRLNTLRWNKIKQQQQKRKSFVLMQKYSCFYQPFGVIVQIRFCYSLHFMLLMFFFLYFINRLFFLSFWLFLRFFLLFHRSTYHNHSIRWSSIFCKPNESVFAGIKLFPCISILSIIRFTISIIWNKGKGWIDDSVSTKCRIQQIRFLDIW